MVFRIPYGCLCIMPILTHLYHRISKQVFFALMLIPTACLSQPECPRPLTLGWDLWEPYQSLSDKGVAGLDIELITAILKEAGCEVTFVRMPWKRHLKAIEIGTIDLAAGASKTPLREDFAYFTDAYRKENVALFVRSQELEKHQTSQLETLFEQGFRLGVTRGNYYGETFEALANQQEIQPQIQAVNNYVLNYNKLLKGRIDGFLSDVLASQHTLEKNQLNHLILPHPKLVYQTKVHLMVSRASVSPELMEQINRSLTAFKKRPEYDNILNNYHALP